MASSLAPSMEGARQEWVRYYDGPAHEQDYARAMAVDDSGYVYVTGASSDTNAEFATMKYAPNGDLLWVRRFDSTTAFAGPAALALDKLGHVYVAGGSVDYEILKYHFNGDTAWVRRFHEPLDGYDAASALVVDSAGNVYVTGEGANAIQLNDRDFVTVKYTPAGDTAWVRRYSYVVGPISIDYAVAVAVDRDGFVYVCGTSLTEALQPDVTTIKYSPAGDTVWTRRYDGDSFSEEPTALAVDTAGNAYVTGESGLDFFTIKYTPSGDTAWVRRHDGPANAQDRGTGLATAPSGGVYVTGWSMGVSTDHDIVTIKYAASGDTLWVRRLNSPANSSDEPRDIVVDSLDQVYVTGSNGICGDVLTVKYSSTGELLWQRSYNAEPLSCDWGAALGLDAQGALYVTGGSGTEALLTDFCTLKYVPCAIAVTGDLNESGTVQSADIITAVNYVFKGGADPAPCPGAADVDCSSSVTSSDIIHLVNYVFKGGTLPCHACDGPLALSCGS